MVGVDAVKRRRRSTARRAGGIMTLLALVNVAVGLVYQAILAAYLGLTAAADSFQYAYTLVTFGCVVVLSMVPSVMVPRMRPTPGGGYSVADCLYPVGAGAFLTGALVGVSFLSSIDNDAATIMRWGAGSCMFAGLAAGAQAIALLERRFALAGAGAVVNGCVGVATLMLAVTPESGPRAYGSAIAVGYAAQAVAMFVGLGASGTQFFWHPTLHARSFVGYFLFTIVAKFQPVLERILAAAIGVVGATAALGFGQKVAQGVLLVASFGLSLTAIPALTGLARAGDNKSAAALLAKVATATVVSTSVVLALALPLSYPAVALLFERQSFTVAEVHQVQQVLLLQLPWVAANALAAVGTSVLYVLGWYGRLLISAACGLVATLVSAVALTVWDPTFAVAAASSFGAIASLSFTTYLVLRSPVGMHAIQSAKSHTGLPSRSIGVLAATTVVYAGSAVLTGVDSVFCVVGTMSFALAGFVTVMSSARMRAQARIVFDAEV